MKLQISLFGITKDIIGKNSINIEMSSGVTAQELIQELIVLYPALSKIVSLVLAVNNEYADSSLMLSESDTIALIPPVSGG
ncbi:MAG: MoaD/ThiS family protein [Pseudarcicella sp.]|jgi:molybdopterin synthase sulfur carrier subunit|nr:MoaD/ThiS family protein [Pseudarcicella sp.]MBP6409823.1 MoaD/ThiS family protein [Pseudarcicella sp.]